MKEIISKFLLQRKRKNEETKRRIVEDKAKAFVYVSNDERCYPCVYIHNVPVLHIFDGESCLQDRNININDVQPFVENLRKFYVETHKDKIFI